MILRGWLPFVGSFALLACAGRVAPTEAPDSQVAPGGDVANDDAGDGACANDDCHDGTCAPTLVADAPARGDGLAVGADGRLYFGLSFVNQTTANAGLYSVDRCGTDSPRRVLPTAIALTEVRNEGDSVLFFEAPMASDAGVGSVTVIRGSSRFSADAHTTIDFPLVAFDGHELVFDDADDGHTHAIDVTTRAERVLGADFYRVVSDGARWYGFGAPGLVTTNLDGGDVRVLTDGKYPDVRDLTHDDEALYWITYGTASFDGPTDGHAYRVSKDGGAVVDLFDGRRVGNEIVVDDHTAYFCSNGWLYRVPKTGGDATVVYRGDVASGDACFALAVDATYLYWIDTLSVLRLRKTW